MATRTLYLIALSVFGFVSAAILRVFAGVGRADEPAGVHARHPEIAGDGLDEAVIGGRDGP
ncbi:hypothetical protein [Rhodovulum sulfidophilum]|uniref:Uncharacterized protein n=1 Tax=Rhodovulum sulfidophilum TaxID=35806 RepID=A0ABS1RXQ7_RHOSU|nr:hypothetical protein [Rhodovulum sulfidophilum]MBL3610403.1 hypothetical protein [Rhodovulum sulfidophilum]MCE8457119.1 hypothetical protein [Rhodovulum sulfidophilum]